MDPRHMHESEMVRAMGEAFDRHLRDKLRARILAAVEPEVNAAIDEAMASFSPSVVKLYVHAMGEAVVKVILDDRRKTQA